MLAGKDVYRYVILVLSVYSLVDTLLSDISSITPI